MIRDIDEEETVSGAVVTAVSALKGRDHDTLEPLGETIDTDALEAIFAPCLDGSARCGGRVSFIYSHCRVTVDNNEQVEVTIVPPGRPL